VKFLAKREFSDSTPAELDLRRNIIRRIVGLLESKYLKECWIQFL